MQVAYIELPEQAKEGKDGSIDIIKGKPYNSGGEICERLQESLGKEELGRLDITIHVEEEAKYKDNLSIIIIKYFPDKKKVNDFYYFVQGLENGEVDSYPGTYGEMQNNKVTWFE